MGRGKYLFRVAAMLLLACLTVQTAHAVAPGASVKTCVARLGEGQDPAALMNRPAAFDCERSQIAHGQGDFLVQLRFAPAKAEPGDQLQLRINSVWQDGGRIRFRYVDGSEATIAFSSGDVSRFITIGAIWEFPVPSRDAPLETVFIETRGSANIRDIVQGAQLVSRSEAYGQKLWLASLYAGFAGLALVLIVYNLSLWAAMRHQFQMEYCRMVIALSAYTFTASGLAEILLPGMDGNDRLRLNYFLLAGFGATTLRFVRHFFEERVFGEALQRMTTAACVSCLAAGILWALLAPWHLFELDRAYSTVMLLAVCTIFPIVVSAWRARSRYFWLFVLAWSPPVAVSLLRVAHGFNLVGYNFLLDNGNLVAMSIEALLSALMVTARVRELSLERDHARAGEQMARRLAATDPLTGLLNRRAFLDLAIGRRARHRLMLIDVDHFKVVNDRLGHDAGDEVLRAVADAIQRCRPARSLAVRLGGEEFALLIPRSSVGECSAEAVLEAVRHHAMPQSAKVTVSIGFADGSVATEDDWKRLYRLADAALYRAKSDGRDRACRATDFRAAA